MSCYTFSSGYVLVLANINGMDSEVGMRYAVLICVKLAQREIYYDMEQSISTVSGEKVHGRFKRLAPFLAKMVYGE